MKLLVLTLLSFSFIGCVASKDEKAKPVPTTAFGKASAGAWISECQANLKGYYRDTMLLDGVSAGSSTLNYYADNVCTQADGRQDATQEFTYTTQDISATASKVTVTVDGRQFKLDVSISFGVMKVSDGKDTILFSRIQQAAEEREVNKPANPEKDNKLAMDAFDRLAIGVWRSRDCQTGRDGRSYLEFLTIKGNGQASTMYGLFDDANCQRNQTSTSNNHFDYSVNQFANGAGEMVITGEVVRVSVTPTTLTTVGSGGTANYVRIK